MADISAIKSITEAHEFLSLGKPKHPLVSVFRHEDMVMPDGYEAYRISLNLYQVMLKEGISGSLGYGRNSYDFQEGTIIFTSPGQVISAVEGEETFDPKGWSLIFHPDLIRKSELGQTIDIYSFFSYEVHEALHLSDEEKQSLTDMVENITREIQQNIDQHSQKLIISTIKLMLDYCSRYYDRQFYTRTNLNQDTVTKFERLMKSYYNSEKPLEFGIPSVKYCGQELAMSPNYLSDLLKKETGMNAHEHIQFYVINKAKNRLLGSTDSISQIAYSLGFEYPQHFSKMFKSTTGMSPTEYRILN